MNWTVAVRAEYDVHLEVEARDQTEARRKARQLDGREVHRELRKVVAPQPGMPPYDDSPPPPYGRDED